MKLLRLAALALVVVVLSSFAVAGLSAVDRGADRTGETGLAFREVADRVGFAYNTSEPSAIMSNAGVYAADYDRDGWTDLLAVGSSDRGPVLFHNDHGTFSPSGLLDGIDRDVRAAAFVDYDGDGDDDLLLFPWQGSPIVLANDGDGFHRADGVLDVALARPVGAAAGDYDGDGCVDLFVVQNGDWTERLPRESKVSAVSPDEDNGEPNLLFDGTCGGFENATEAAGVRGATWSLAASMVDLDGDGRPDVHVANDFNNDVVYWNDGDGTFTREVLPNETNRNGMASEVGDFTGDGRLDVFVTNIYLPPGTDGGAMLLAENRSDGNNLLVNEGDRQIVPGGERCGVSEGGWGWAAVGADLDNDGDQDIFHATLEFTLRLGMDLLRVRKTSPVYSYPVLFEHRDGAGCQFASRNASDAGFQVTDGHGVAQVDFDRDGDLDVAMAVSPGPTGDARFRLYENVGATGGAIQVRLRDDASTPLGARVYVGHGDDAQVRALHSRTDYFSQDSRVLHFGIGNRSAADVRVVWPDGSERTVADVPADTRLVVSRDGVERRVALNGPPWPLAGGLTGPVALLVVALAALVAAVVYRRYGGSPDR